MGALLLIVLLESFDIDLWSGTVRRCPIICPRPDFADGIRLGNLYCQALERECIDAAFTCHHHR